MDNEYRKPYLAALTHTAPQTRYYVYPREALKKEPIFPYLVLDGGAFLFAAEHFGDASSDTLLEKTLSGELFELFWDENGEMDWGRSYHLAAASGMPKQHEWQSWPQRLYMLLPLAQAYLRTSDRKYAAAWLRILKNWADFAPYEPLQRDVSHVNTSMRWRDMQVSWRAMTLLHSLYMLGTHDGAFTEDEWREIYAFLELNLDHLAEEAQFVGEKGRLGNHTLQMASVLVTAGIVFAELPRARAYFDCGKAVMTACFAFNVMPDGGTKEVGPSYNHFIARLYLEAQKNCELNGYPEIEGLHDSVIRQYQWLASVATKDGRALRLSDAYGMDAHADVRRMGEIFPFQADFSKPSIRMPDSEYIILRNSRWELALDAMAFFGGHQHYGRVQPLLWADGEEILTDTGCCNYDRNDLYVWGKTAEAHSVVTCAALPFYASRYDVEVLEADLSANTVRARVTVQYEERSYVWTRSVRLTEDGAWFSDRVQSSEPLEFQGRWYLAGRPTALEESECAEDPIVHHAPYLELGHVARQRLSRGPMTLRSSALLHLDHTPAMGEDNRVTYLDRLTWTKTGTDFTVETRILYR